MQWRCFCSTSSRCSTRNASKEFMRYSRSSTTAAALVLPRRIRSGPCTYYCSETSSNSRCGFPNFPPWRRNRAQPVGMHVPTCCQTPPAQGLSKPLCPACIFGGTVYRSALRPPDLWLSMPPAEPTGRQGAGARGRVGELPSGPLEYQHGGCQQRGPAVRSRGPTLAIPDPVRPGRLCRRAHSPRKAYARGAKIGNAENCEFEGSTAVMTKRQWGAQPQAAPGRCAADAAISPRCCLSGFPLCLDRCCVSV